MQAVQRTGTAFTSTKQSNLLVAPVFLRCGARPGASSLPAVLCAQPSAAPSSRKMSAQATGTLIRAIFVGAGLALWRPSRRAPAPPPPAAPPFV